MGERVESFRDLRVFEAAVVLRRRVFVASKSWPREERYALTDQIRRSSRSVGANVAEAWSKRRYPKRFVAKLTDAHGEAEETGVWLDTAHECGHLTDDEHADLRALARACAGGLAAMIRQSEKWPGSPTTPGAAREPVSFYNLDLDGSDAPTLPE